MLMDGKGRNSAHEPIGQGDAKRGPLEQDPQRHDGLPRDLGLDETEAQEQDQADNDRDPDGRVGPRELVAAEGHADEEEGDGPDEGESSQDVDPLELGDDGAGAGRDVDLPGDDDKVDDAKGNCRETNRRSQSRARLGRIEEGSPL